MKRKQHHAKTIGFGVRLVLVWILVMCFSNILKAYPNASSWELTSPKKNEVIKSGELFVTVRLLDSVKIRHASLEFYIDDNLITTNVKFAPDRISILYTLPLPEGPHVLQVKVNTDNIGYLTTIASTFYVNKFSGDRKDSVVQKKADFFELSGTLYGLDKEMSYTGAGANNALGYPNLPYIREYSIDAVARVGKVSFPVKYFNTSDQSFNPDPSMSRNYLQYGIRYAGAEFLYGDQTPNFDRLVMAGIRVKGWMFTYEGPRFKVQIVNGISQFKVEGQKLQYKTSDSIPPPATLRADSSYIVPGMYQRQISAARFSFGNRIEGSVTSINLLRARDDTNSIQYGPAAADNLVAGADESFVTNGNKMRVNAGFAISAYTANTRGGPATESQVDSLYGYKVGFNPFDYKSIFVLNATTIKPEQPSMADYLTALLRSNNKDNSTNNLVTIDYHYYGNSYVSLGNPLLQNDLWAGTLGDQIDFLNRKVLLSARATYQENDVSANELATVAAKIIYGNLIIAPSPTLPQLSVTVDNEMHNSLGNPASNLVAANDNLLNLNGVLSYNLHLGSTISGFMVNYGSDIRTDAVNSFNSNTIQIIGAGLTETLNSIHLSLDLRYSMMNYSSEETPSLTLSSTYSAHLRYEIKAIKTYLIVGADIEKSNEADLLGSSFSMRNLYNARITTTVLKGMTLDLEAGMAPYTDLAYSSNSYQENYGLVRLMYNFDFKQ